MRLLHLVEGDAQVALTHALYRAYFEHNLDIADRAVLAGVLSGVGLDPQLAASGIDGDAPKAALRAETAAAVADGIFGVPGFVVDREGERRLFWGQDRMHLVEAYVAGAPR
jgi:2-hydroxychromene-2-carboxylate isomerase